MAVRLFDTAVRLFDFVRLFGCSNVSSGLFGFVRLCSAVFVFGCVRVRNLNFFCSSEQAVATVCSAVRQVTTSLEPRWKAPIFFRAKTDILDFCNLFWFYCNSPNGYAH